jgi:predicted PurR-regulated permease PerM
MERNWSRATRLLVGIAALGVLVWLLVSARALIGPLVVAALLAYALYPVVDLVSKRTKLSRTHAAVLVFVVFLVLLGAVLAVFVPVIITQVKRLSLELESIRGQMEDMSAISIPLLDLELPIDQLLTEFDTVFFELLGPDRVFRVLRSATSNLVWVLVILVTAYHLLRDWERLREWLIRLAPEEYQPDIRQLHAEIKVVWNAYLRGQLLLMLVVGLLSGIISSVIGLPGPAAFGALAGILELVPSLGPTVTAVVAAAVAWFDGSSTLGIPNFWFAVLVVALFSVVQLVENVWLQPRIMGRAVKLHPGLVFVAVVGALVTSGVLVALVIVPLVGTAALVGRYVHRRALGLPPWPE